MPVNNHTVLLKGVNDDLETMRQLMRALLRIKVRPYYLFHCDPVIGAGHFRTSVWKGLEIMEGLRGHMSGLGIPTYVVDSPHGGGKIPLMPNYLVSAVRRRRRAAQLRRHAGPLPGGGQSRHRPADGDARRQFAAAGHQDRPDARGQRTHGPSTNEPSDGGFAFSWDVKWRRIRLW